jgi:tRNA pseudouridine38-40 synthase
LIDTRLEESALGSGKARRFALLLEYDGTGFAGSQLQTNARTVQSVLEAAIERATSETVRVAFAGRTDAGVHAYGQVASFVSGTKLSPDVLQRALNAWLPADVVVRQLAEVGEDFDPRRQAVRRHYRYLIDNGGARPALRRDRAWHVGQPLDIEAMQEAAHGLLGSHDFAAFASPLEDAIASTVRELFRFDVRARRDIVTCDLVGNAFLPHQVRRMTGALVEVGKGRLGIDGYAGLLDRPPASAGPVAPAHGLYLVGVAYERDPFGRAALDSEDEVC